MTYCTYCNDTGRVVIGFSARKCGCQVPRKSHNVTQAKLALEAWQGRDVRGNFGFELAVRAGRNAGLSDELIVELCGQTLELVQLAE